MSLKVNDLILQSSEKQSSQLVDSIQVSRIVCENVGNGVVDANGSLASVTFECLDSNNQRITTITNSFIVNLQSTPIVGAISSWYLFYRNVPTDSNHIEYYFDPVVANGLNLSRVSNSDSSETYLSTGSYLCLYTSWEFEGDAPTDINYYKEHLGIRSIDFIGVDL